MKPHEETWDEVPGVEVDVRDIIAVGEGGVIRDVPSRVSLLIAKAPAMARALLEHVEACDVCKGTGLTSIRDGATRVDVECTGCSDDRAILTDAGVLP